MNTASDRSGSLETALAHTRRLLLTNPELAVEQADEILKAAPNHPVATMLLGVAQRVTGRIPQALLTLERLVDSQPQWAVAHYERGRAFEASGEQAAALAALRRAVALKPDLPHAWRSIGDLCTLAGDLPGADAAYAQHLKAATQDPRLLSAGLALVDSRIPEAEALLRTHLRQNPTDVAALRMLAEVAARLSRNADAESLLERCLELMPSFDAARHQYAIVLHRQNKSVAALREIETLMQAAPLDATYRNLKAVILTKIGQYAASIELYAAVLKAQPEQARIWLSYGHTLATAGREADSIAAYRESIARAPTLGEAYWSLANLKTFRFDAAETKAMRARLARQDLAGDDRLHFAFALGKALEDAGEYAASFDHYRTANALRRAGINYDPAETSAFVRRSKALFSSEFFDTRSTFGESAPDPIFIVGLPRAGSTLIEQILASHPQVEGTMELPDLIMMAANLGGDRKPAAERRYPAILATLGDTECRALGLHYLETTRIQRKTGRPLFIDKMPNNFLHIGLIRLILPNAKIIDARRHPMACCFSGFKQQFAEGHWYSYDLAEIGRYYRDYVEYMQHVDVVAPGKVHRVVYEQLIDDTEGEVRRLLTYCGLPFHDACLRFYDNARPVRTASAQQVRKPIFRTGLDQWRHYEAWLAPLSSALGDVLTTYPASPQF